MEVASLPAPPPPHRAGPLLERAAELEAVASVAAGAAAGEGRVLVVEGPAGIGKSRLMLAVRGEAEAAGLRVLAARGSELEGAFGFGVVRQLFETALVDPGAAERLLAGAAAAARPVVSTVVDDGAPGDVSFAALHGLYWLAVNMAGERPLALLVDDLHWCDRPSLRFLAYLARRLEGLPLLVAVSLRPTEPGADASLTAEIAGDPAAVRLAPAALTPAAAGELIGARLGAVPDDEFARACHRATGGNPLLLTELAAAMRTESVAPVAEHAAAVLREVGPRAVMRAVNLRLGRLPAQAVAVARAAAVLGEGADIARVAELACADEADAARATGVLARAEILRPDPPLGFVHPLVRAAVYHEIAPGERARQHGCAARLLAAAGAPEEQVAAHLLASPPRDDPGTVDVLRRAARVALSRGAAESAVAYLSRALAERAGDGERPQLLVELGEAQGFLSGPAAAASLREAYALTDDPALRARAGTALVKHLLFVGSPAEARALAEREAEATSDPDLRDQLWANRLSAAFYDPATLPLDAPDFLPHRRPAGDGMGARMLSGVAAYQWAMTGGSAAECVPLALHAVGGGAMRSLDSSGVPTVAGIIVLILADHPEADRVTELQLGEGHRTGSLFVASGGYIFRGLTLLLHGELAEADRSLATARELQDTWGQHNVRLFPAAYHAETLIERGDLDGARRALEWAGLPPDEELPGNSNIAWWLGARLRFLLAAGDLAAAAALGARCGDGVGSAVVNPAWLPWRSLTALALHGLGRVEEAGELARAEVAAARRWGAPSATGRALRVLGSVTGDLDVLGEAADVLEASPARLERARALTALGTALRLARRPTEAREPLRRALELATLCEAAPLAERARAEIHATGARPRVEALSGVAALTASERRVADLAVAGGTNREIAQALYVTPKTVEVHLSSVYRKLGIRSRRQLPAALAA